MSATIKHWLNIAMDKALHYFGFIRQTWNPTADEILDEQQVNEKLQDAEMMAQTTNSSGYAVLRQELLKKAPQNQCGLQWLLKQELKLQNFLAADGLLSRLLFCEPGNIAKYSEIRQNCASAADSLADEIHTKIDGLHQKYIQIVSDSAKQEKILKMRKNVFLCHYLHHTLVMEGSTLSVEEITEFMEKDEEERMRDLMPIGDDPQWDPIKRENFLELVGLNDVLAYVEEIGFCSPQDLATKLTIDFIKNVHFKMFEKIESEELSPVQAGQFRNDDAFIGPYMAIPSADLENEMGKFVGNFLSEGIQLCANKQMHPVELAALTHYYFVKLLCLILQFFVGCGTLCLILQVHIHPVNDGNGRIARLLVNLILQCYKYPPVIIQHQFNQEYYDALGAANEGDLRVFLRFMEDLVLRTLKLGVREGLPYPLLLSE